MPNCITILCVLYLYCLYFISALYIDNPTGKFGLTIISLNRHSPNTWNRGQELTLISVNCIRVGHSNLLSEFFVYSNHLCVSIKSMNMMKKGMYTSRPRLLSETNYGYWKIHMSVFIKSL